MTDDNGPRLDPYFRRVCEAMEPLRDEHSGPSRVEAGRQAQEIIAEAERRWNHPNLWKRYRRRLAHLRLMRRVDRDLRRRAE